MGKIHSIVALACTLHLMSVTRLTARFEQVATWAGNLGRMKKENQKNTRLLERAVV